MVLVSRSGEVITAVDTMVADILRDIVGATIDHNIIMSVVTHTRITIMESATTIHRRIITRIRSRTTTIIMDIKPIVLVSHRLAL